jgi:putative ABC transport system substrate-binding protein
MALALVPPAAETQVARTPVIGVLFGNTASESQRFRDALVQGLREHGYVEGRNVRLEYRYADGRPDAYAPLADELVQLGVTVLVAQGNPAATALVRATRSIPIVLGFVADPVGSGFVGSLDRPGGNVTGVSTLAEGVSTKWVELLGEVAPRATRLAVLFAPGTAAHAVMVDEIQGAVQGRKVTVRSWEMRHADDIERTFSALVADGTGAVIVLPHPIASTHHRQIIALAVKHRLPTVYAFSWFAEAGGLMTYGANTAAVFGRVAGYVDRILKGTKPADPPVEQPTKFELVINSKTARALGLTMPPTLLLRADRLIE